MLFFQVLTSFFVGGIFIATQTIIAERAPEKWRSIILTIPNTMAISFLFIGLTKSPKDIIYVANFYPASLAVCYVFVAAFASLSNLKLFYRLIVAYIFWLLSAFFILKFPPTGFLMAVTVYFLPVILLSYWTTKRLPSPPPFKPMPITLKIAITRAIISGSIIALAIIMAKTLGNTWGSLFSAFPAAFTSNFIIYHRAYGKTVIPSIAKLLFFPGSAGFIIYALVSAQIFPKYGIWWGTITSYASVFIFLLSFSYIRDLHYARIKKQLLLYSESK